MATPILEVDDLPMARKNLIKSLPSGWDVEFPPASNGSETLTAYRAGKADIMFLDPPMPEVDGFEVLEALQKEVLNCLVIAVPADMQTFARGMAKKHGAIACVKKLIVPGEIEAVLGQYGVMP